MTEIIRSSSSLEDRLDADILHIRREIESMRTQHSNLRAAILSSTKIQNQIRSKTKQTHSEAQAEKNQERNSTHHLQQPSSTLATSSTAQTLHNTTNIYRLAFGVTSFPFTDPSPENAGNSPLLGLRFDVPSKTNGVDNEETQTPYYVFLKKIKQDAGDLEVHHHSIPAHIDLDSLVKKYLPAPDEDEDMVQGEDETAGGHVNGDGGDSRHTSTQPRSIRGVSEEVYGSRQTQRKNQSQDVHAFASHLRASLVSFHLRTESIGMLAKQLHIGTSSAAATKTQLLEGLYSISSLSAGDPAARQIRIVWKDGSVGRLKISDNGNITMAVVFSGKDNKRLNDAERILAFGVSGDAVRVGYLIERLRVCDEKGIWK